MKINSSNSTQELIAENFQMIQSAAAKADANEITLREFLQASDGNLVKNFLEKCNTFGTCTQEQQRQTSSHVHLQWTVNTDLFIMLSLLAWISTQVPKINTTSVVSIQLKLVQNITKIEKVIEGEIKITGKAGNTRNWTEALHPTDDAGVCRILS